MKLQVTLGRVTSSSEGVGWILRTKETPISKITFLKISAGSGTK